MRKEILKSLPSPKHAQHVEGRIAALSGNHPLHALCSSATARQQFEQSARALARIFARFDIRGYQMVTGDMQDVMNALHDKIGLAMQQGELKRIGYYGAMAAARAVAEIGGKVFHCGDLAYSEELHALMSRGQARVRSDDDINLGDVFSFFGLFTTAAFTHLLAAVERKLRRAGQKLSSCTLGGLKGDHDTVNWRTLLVLLCEARQAIRKFGAQQIYMIIHALESAGLDAICQIRKAHAQLMQRGYAKGCGECHCTAMLRAASVAVNVKLVKKKFKRNSLHVAGDLQDIVMHLAFWRLCPKVSSRNIPEFVALNEAVRCFKSEIDSCQPSPTVATLICKVIRRASPTRVVLPKRRGCSFSHRSRLRPRDRRRHWMNQECSFISMRVKGRSWHGLQKSAGPSSHSAKVHQGCGSWVWTQASWLRALSLSGQRTL